MSVFKGKVRSFGLLSLLGSILLMSFPLIVTTDADIRIEGMDPTEGSPGTWVNIFGDGATSNGTVIILFGDLTVEETFADTYGWWEGSLKVPSVPPGEYMVYAVDEVTETNDSVSFIVTLPHIWIDYVYPHSGSVGTRIEVHGCGATPYGEVRVYFHETSVYDTMAWGDGCWSAYFVVPHVEPGSYVIKALDVATSTTDTAVFEMTPPPTIHVSAPEAAIGSKITITGEGFRSERSLYIGFEDLLFFTPIYVDEKGEFNATVFVPVVNSGNCTIKAVDTYYYGESRQALANVSFRVTVGLDTLFQMMDDTQNALNQTQNMTQPVRDEVSLAKDAANSAKDEATAAKESAESAVAMANEARTYVLTTMMFAIIATALSAIVLIKRT